MIHMIKSKIEPSNQIFDRNKKAHYLRYYMVKLGESWKISGVEILPSSDFSV